MQDPASWVNIHHLEYTDGGILDPDDVLADVVEDKDKVELVWKCYVSFQIKDDAFSILGHLAGEMDVKYS